MCIMNNQLRECAKVLNCEVNELTIDDLEDLVCGGYDPIPGIFSLEDGKTYHWVDKLPNIVDEFGWEEEPEEDFGYLVVRVQIDERLNMDNCSISTFLSFERDESWVLTEEEVKEITDTLLQIEEITFVKIPADRRQVIIHVGHRIHGWGCQVVRNAIADNSLLEKLHIAREVAVVC